MKRSDFLKLSPALSLPFMLNGLSLTAAAHNPLLHLLSAQTAENGKVLVLIQLSGGNDGLNTLIPLDQYSNLVKARNNILIPENRVLGLKGVPETGLHPSMTDMQGMYNNGLMNIVQAASYPNPSFSHFRATDIWLTGSDTNTFLNTGWLGRSLESVYTGYPVNYPNTDMPDPLAIQIGSQASLVTQCTTINPTVTVSNPASFYELINGITDTIPDTPYGHELTFIRLIKTQTEKYTSVIKNAFNRTSDNTIPYPQNNMLADQLKIVARLIKGELKTPVYVVNHPASFDTHASQVDSTDTTTGAHATLLASLTAAVNAFQQDLINMKVNDRVTSMTITEFGRRIKSNDSLGTDHGAATPIFFFGTGLNPVIIGNNPHIPDNISSSDQVNMQYDFRAVYYSVLKDWFLLTDEQLGGVLPDAYTTLPIFRQTALPVKLLSFTGNWLNDAVNLEWQTDQESGIDHYEVQRSGDGTSFVKIGALSALNTSTRNAYKFTDRHLTQSRYFYRIRIVEKSGTTAFSSVLLLKTNQASAGIRIKIYPNPATDRFTILSENKITGTVTATLSDLNGKEIWKQEQEVAGLYNFSFTFTGKKPVAGLYVVKLHTKNEEATARILIQ
ncbi:MAG: DUF1501 domain-containing protein [Bacteroidota bacterium]